MATVTGFDLNTTTPGVDGTTSYTEGGAARRLAQNASVTATGNFAGQTLTISGLLAEDELGFANGVSIVGNAIQINGTTIGTFAGGTGGSDFVVTFNSNALASQVQRLLRNITYKDLSDDPAPNRTLTIDLAGTVRADVVTVTAVNDRPVVDLDSSIAGSNALASFVEQTAVAIAPSAVITDPDAASFVSLTATLRSRPDGDSAESLSLSTAAQAAAGGLTVSYDAATGTLSISGSASAAAYQTILTGIAYSNTSDNPATANRRVDVVISDGTVSSALRTVTISVARTNDAPVLDLNGGAPGDTASIAYNTGDPLTAIAPAGTIVDADSANFNGGSLRVAFAGGTGGAEDRLGVITDATVTLTGAGASTVRVGGTAIGTLSGGTGGTDLVVALNSAATPARVQTLLEHIGYSNSSSTPSGSTRTVTFTVVDGDGGLDAGSATATIVLATNDAPVLTGDLSAAVAEGGIYAITTSDLNFADPDDSAADVTFAVTAQLNGTVLVNGVAAASFTGQQLADGLISFAHDGSETATAAFDVTVEDGNEDGSAPTAQPFNFTVTALNDAPVLTGDLSAAVAEGGIYAITTSDLNFADPDDSAADVTFAVTAQLNGTVLVSGVAAASFTGQQLADGLISFAHDGSETATAAFDVTVEDGNEDGSAPTAQTFNFAVTAVNDAPVLTGDLSATVGEGGTYAITTSDLNFADPDDGVADVTFAVTSQVNGTVLVSGVAAASFTGQQLADGLISFAHDGSETTAAAFDVTVEDGNEDGSAPTAQPFNFTVTALNDAPVLTGDLSAAVAEGGTYAITTSDLNFADPDDSAADVTFAVTAQLNGTVLVSGVAAASFTGQQLADGLISFAHDGSETTAAAFDVTVEDGNEDGSAPTAQTFNFAVTALNDAPTANPVDLGAIAEEGTRLITEAELLGGVTDPDGPAATITSLTLQNSGGTLLDNGNDTWTYTGATNDDTSVTFAYTASDGSLSASSTATLDLTPVDDGMTIERVSVTNAGAQGNGASGALGSGFPIIFGENRYVAFYSNASNLVPGDTNGKGDFFIHDRVLDTVERVVAGINGPSDGAILTASADGRYLAFNSLSPSLVGGDTNGTSDIFVYDRLTQTYERIGGNGYSSGANISADGRFVAFHSHANNLVAGDTNNAPDCFIYDRDTGTIERVLGPGGVQDNSGASPTDISGDGRYTVFYSNFGGFVAGDTNGQSDTFVYDRVLDIVERVSVASGGGQGNGASESASITPDGRFVAFTSTSSNLVANDTNNQRDIFVHDRLTGTTERVSLTSGGAQLNGGSQVPTISDDGRYVAFHSLATNGVSDTNGTEDAFVFDRQLDTLVRVSSISTGAAGNGQSAMATVSADGHYVTFASFATNLVGGDTNGFQDVFLAHLSASGWVLV